MQTAQTLGKSTDAEVWWKHPNEYIIELRENAGSFNTIWHSDYIHKRNLNPQAFLGLHLGSATSWKTLIVQHWYDLAVLYTSESPRKSVAAWPIWNANLHSVSKLMDLVKNPISERDEYYDLDKKYKPSKNQDHRIIVTGIGSVTQNYYKDLVNRISEIQENYPEVTFLICNVLSFGATFGKGFKMVEADPLTPVRKWAWIILPNGKHLSHNHPELAVRSYWLNVLGFDYKELDKNWHKMISFNICSYEWASRYYLDLARHTGRGYGSGHANVIDWRSPQAEEFFVSNNRIFAGAEPKGQGRKPTDRLECSSCSLWAACKYYREGSVCSVPGSEMEEVANMFGSRDADKIIDAMGALLKLNTERIQEARSNESSTGELDPELTKIITSTLNNAEKLAKLRNPELNGKSPTVTVNTNINSAQTGLRDNSITPAVAMHIVSQLEAQGFKREEITEDLIQDYLTRITVNTAAGLPIRGELA